MAFECPISSAYLLNSDYIKRLKVHQQTFNLMNCFKTKSSFRKKKLALWYKDLLFWKDKKNKIQLVSISSFEFQNKSDSY